MFKKLKNKIADKIKSFKAEVEACEKEFAEAEYNQTHPYLAAKYTLGEERLYTKEQVKQLLKKKLESLIPKERVLVDFVVSTPENAIEWGMYKQEQMERLIYLRALNELDQFLNEN